MFIKEEIIDLFRFLRKPKDAALRDAPTSKKWKLWTTTLLLELVFSTIIVVLLALLDSFVVPLDYTDSLLEEHIIVVFLAMCVFAPLFEEFIFRLPLRYRNNYIFQLIDKFTKRRLVRFWYKHYGVFFYAFAIAFGLIHITNYNNNSFIFYAFAPIIVGSQIFDGLVMGYTRVRLGFWWGVLQHSAFNFMLFLLPLTLFNTDTKIDIQNKGRIESLKLEEVEFRTGSKEKDIRLHSYMLIEKKGDSFYTFDSLQYHEIKIKYMSLKRLIDEIANQPINIAKDSLSYYAKPENGHKYQLLDNNVLVNFHLKAKEPILVDEIMDIIAKEYDIEIVKDTARIGE